MERSTAIDYNMVKTELYVNILPTQPVLSAVFILHLKTVKTAEWSLRQRSRYKVSPGRAIVSLKRKQECVEEHVWSEEARRSLCTSVCTRTYCRFILKADLLVCTFHDNQLQYSGDYNTVLYIIDKIKKTVYISRSGSFAHFKTAESQIICSLTAALTKGTVQFKQVFRDSVRGENVKSELSFKEFV